MKVVGTIFAMLTITVGGIIAPGVSDAKPKAEAGPVGEAPATLLADRATANPRSNRSFRRVSPTAVAKPAKPKPTLQSKPSNASTRSSSKPITVTRGPAWVERIRFCIMQHESHGNYKALNRYSGASGAYQFMDATWHAVTGLSGKAMNYPPAVQDAAFYKLFANGKGARNWTTYSMCA